MKDDFKKDSHPAYGCVGFYRTEGNPGRMFSSALKQHGYFISLVIKQADVEYGLGREWIHGHGKSLIEVWLSAAQFAQLLTTMNVGSGVPCTIKYINGKEVPKIPEHKDSEQEKIVNDFKETTNTIISKMRSKAQNIKEILSRKGTVKASEKKDILKFIEWLEIEIKSNFPFILRSFQKSVEKTSVHAKAELDAMVSKVIYDTGLDTLKKQRLNHQEHKVIEQHLDSE